MRGDDTGARSDRTARIAGTLYLALLPLGIFSFVVVPASLVAPGDAAETARRIAASPDLFRAGIASHLLSQVLVVAVALLLHRLFSPVDRTRAMGLVACASICAAISFVSESHQLAALARPGEVGPRLDLARDTVLLAQVFWGLWSLVLAGLVRRSGFLPRWLAWTAAIAGLGYLADSASQLLVPGGPAVAMFTAPAELVLPVWLIVRGVRADGGG